MHTLGGREIDSPAAVPNYKKYKKVEIVHTAVDSSCLLIPILTYILCLN